MSASSTVSPFGTNEGDPVGLAFGFRTSVKRTSDALCTSSKPGICAGACAMVISARTSPMRHSAWMSASLKCPNPSFRAKLASLAVSKSVDSKPDHPASLDRNGRRSTSRKGLRSVVTPPILPSSRPKTRTRSSGNEHRKIGLRHGMSAQGRNLPSR